MPGLKRIDLVFLNRLQRDYTQDKLPNPEQTRFDVGILVGLVERLDKEIDKMSKREA